MDFNAFKLRLTALSQIESRRMSFIRGACQKYIKLKPVVRNQHNET